MSFRKRFTERSCVQKTSTGIGAIGARLASTPVALPKDCFDEYTKENQSKRGNHFRLVVYVFSIFQFLFSVDSCVVKAKSRA